MFCCVMMINMINMIIIIFYVFFVVVLFVYLVDYLFVWNDDLKEFFCLWVRILLIGYFIGIIVSGFFYYSVICNDEIIEIYMFGIFNYKFYIFVFIWLLLLI